MSRPDIFISDVVESARQNHLSRANLHLVSSNSSEFESRKVETNEDHLIVNSLMSSSETCTTRNALWHMTPCCLLREGKLGTLIRIESGALLGFLRNGSCLAGRVSHMRFTSVTLVIW